MLTFEHSFKTLRELKHGLFYLICRRRGVYTSDFSVLVSRNGHTICDVTSYVAVALDLRLVDKVTHFVIRFNPGGDAVGELERQYSELLKGHLDIYLRDRSGELGLGINRPRSPATDGKPAQ